jgi:hypothetical protein
MSRYNYPTKSSIQPTSIMGGITAIADKITVTSSGNAVSLGDQRCGHQVYIIADPDNAGDVYVYPVDGSKGDVIPLSAGDHIVWPVRNVSALVVDADNSDDSIYWYGAI